MTDDLVNRLRAYELPGDRQYQREARTTLWSERQEAADRIEKLEAALQRLIDYGMVSFEDLERARKALEGKE
jgi:hypothetical protein